MLAPSPPPLAGKSMTYKHIVVLCSCPDAAVAARIAATLVKEALAACVTRTAAVRSTYSWQGQTCDEAEVLLTMTRRLYPHDGLGDMFYAEVVEALDAKVKADPALAELIKNGVAALDKAKGVPFLELSEGYQTEVLEGLESDAFFQAVRGHTVVALYNNEVVWPEFGYQGSSWQDGGYLFRGFQDIGWTLTPDAEASPPPFLG